MTPHIRNLTISLCIIILAIGGMLAIAIKKQYAQKIISIINNEQTADVGYYKVTNIYDGDTISVYMSGKSEKIRFIGVDTPETHDPDVPVQCFGQEASKYMIETLTNKEVRLESDPTNQNRDRYDRLLRYVYLKDGTLLNEQLIREGYGFAYLRYPFKLLNSFKTSENEARENKKGLWGACNTFIKNGVYQTNNL